MLHSRARFRSSSSLPAGILRSVQQLIRKTELDRRNGLWTVVAYLVLCTGGVSCLVILHLAAIFTMVQKWEYLNIASRGRIRVIHQRLGGLPRSQTQQVSC